MVRAVGKLPDHAPAALKNLTNCVVFNCKGQRSLPSMLGGGDLDGDIYNLILDERLHPTIQFEPGAYTQPRLVTLSRPSTAQDIADFVVNYIKVDITPIVCSVLD
jgi:RNA-dependent RNA polymerase